MIDQNARQSGQLTLSVVLPNYNHARLIGQALDAFLAQQPPADEILVVDDGSTDDSVAVIEKYVAAHPSIRLIRHQRNRGAIAALNTGFNAARGRYIYFGAADDQTINGFFASALAALAAHPEAGLFCAEALVLHGNSGDFYGIRPPVRPVSRAGLIDPAGVKRLLARSDNWILTGCAVFRRDAVAWTGGLDPALGSFADGYMARKIALTYGFYYAPQIVTKWYIYPGSVSRAMVYDLDKARKILDVVPGALTVDPVFPKWYPHLFQRRWRFAVARLALEHCPPDRGLLLGMGAQSARDRNVLGAACRLPCLLASFIALAWLWYRFRPYPLGTLLSTFAARLWERSRRSPAIGAA